MNPNDEKFLRQAIAVAQRARDNGNHPFGAVLVDEKGVVLLEGENTVNTARDATGHAELNLVRAASQGFDTAMLAKCTLYSSTEPCPMCSGGIYWAGIGRVVYAFLPDSPNRLPVGCREILAHGGRGVEVFAATM